MMDATFDPYCQWLGISPAEQPPNHYRLLGVNLFEKGPEAIRSAAERQIAQVRGFENGEHAQDARKIVEQIEAARLCLASPEKKAAYDAQLWVTLTAKTEGWQAGGPPLEYHVKGAAKYLWIQAKRFWIWQLRLPAAHQALGEHVHRERRYPDQLGGLFAQFDAATAKLGALAQQKLESLEESFACRPPGTSPGRARRVWLKLKAAIYRFATEVRMAILGRRRRALLREMGRRAYEIGGQAAGPERLTAPIGAALERLAQLRGEVAQLSVVPVGQLLSPRRLAWIVLALIALPVLLSLWSRLAALWSWL